MWQVLGMVLEQKTTSRRFDYSTTTGLVAELRGSAVEIGAIVEAGHGLLSPVPVSAYDVLGSEQWPEVTRQHVRALAGLDRPKRDRSQRPTGKRRRFGKRGTLRQGQFVFLPDVAA